MPNPFFTNPRNKRLVRDFEEMKALAADSTILEFTAQGDPPDRYELTFHGKGLHPSRGTVDIHRIDLDLKTEYPRSLPAIRWKTPIRHPNISGGAPCFGTFHMNPNVKLVEVVEILWDMARMGTYNPYGGYGDKDIWQVLRKEYDFPVDKRILRDKVPVIERPEDEGGEVDLVIMGSHMGSPLPPSQEWVKLALEQYFDRRELGDQVQLFTADEWSAAGHPQFSDSVGTLVISGDLWERVNAEDEEAKEFQDDLWRLFRKLGVLPNPGMTTPEGAMETHLIPMGIPR